MTSMRTLIIIAALLVLAGPALADEKSGCFARVYDRAHLAKHPDQLVTSGRLHIYPAPRGSAHANWFALRFQVRGREATLRTEGFCVKEGPGLRCQVECDGGGVRVEHCTGHVMMHLDRITVATCGQNVIEDGEEVSGGKDDRDFLLHRVDDAVCAR
jgi:hypothetical protein